MGFSILGVSIIFHGPPPEDWRVALIGVAGPPPAAKCGPAVASPNNRSPLGCGACSQWRDVRRVNQTESKQHDTSKSNHTTRYLTKLYNS
eukprot:1590538-Rhodomonas_salina.1